MTSALESPAVTVIVNNYNHGRFVGWAIESALAQTYPNVRVVVVDDGSTDDSCAEIERFAGRVDVVLKENGGQGSAFNAGFACTSSPIVLFLDSDDYLFPDAVERVVPLFREGVAKVQYRLRVVDGEQRTHGEYPEPDVRLGEGDVLPSVLTCGWYSTAVSSGNAYARAALEAVLPVPEDEFRYGADGYLNATVPFYGTVESIPEQLGAYRIHDLNGYALNYHLDASRFRSQIAHHLATERAIAREAERNGYTVGVDLMLNSVAYLEPRLASLVLDPAGHPFPADRRLALAVRAFRITWTARSGSPLRRAAVSLSLLAEGILPRRLAASVIAWRWNRAERPAFIAFVARVVQRAVRPT